VALDLNNPTKRRQPSLIDVHVGRHLKARRVLANLSQKDLAKSADVTFQQVQKYEKGANRISAGQLYTFSKVLACTPNDFFAGFDGRRSWRVAGGGGPLLSGETLKLVKAFAVLNNRARKAVFDLAKSLSECD
jgi:transcriptional regulator with XRE-family HTH domain